MGKRINPKLNVAVAFILAIGLGVSVTLIVLGGRRSNDSERRPTDSAERTGSTRGPGGSDGSRPPTATLPENKGTSAALSELSGLVFPTDMTDFRSVVYTNNEQIDLTFSAPSSSVERFVIDSKLPAPTSGERLLIHGSPLWSLNPEKGTTISSTEDTHQKVHRTVELIADSSDPGALVQVRISLTPAV